MFVSELELKNSNNNVNTESKKDIEVDKSEKYLGIINSSAKNTLILLDNLLNWAKSQTGQLSYKSEKINLSSMVQNIFEISTPIAKTKKISLNYNQTDDIEFYADVNMLNIVLRNLICNAIKFTNSNGEIVIYAVKNQNNIEVTVSDNGVGMNEETRNKLFKIDSNITTAGTADEKGSGLGLILCKEFIEKQGGEIWVKSELGKGSNFKFTLPYTKKNSRYISKIKGIALFNFHKLDKNEARNSLLFLHFTVSLA
jgi:signal transduction histidine kinase